MEGEVIAVMIAAAVTLLCAVISIVSGRRNESSNHTFQRELQEDVASLHQQHHLDNKSLIERELIREGTTKYRVAGMESLKEVYADLSRQLYLLEYAAMPEENRAAVHADALRTLNRLCLELNLLGPLDLVIERYAMDITQLIGGPINSQALSRRVRQLTLAIRVHLKCEWERVKHESDPRRQDRFEEKPMLFQIISSLRDENDKEHVRAIMLRDTAPEPGYAPAYPAGQTEDVPAVNPLDYAVDHIQLTTLNKELIEEFIKDLQTYGLNTAQAPMMQPSSSLF